LDPVHPRKRSSTMSLGRGVLLRFLRSTAHYLDLVRLHCCVLHLECYVFDEEGPDFVAEAVGVEVALGCVSDAVRCTSLMKRSVDPRLPPTSQCSY
jgi:hypothetical protein